MYLFEFQKQNKNAQSTPLKGHKYILNSLKKLIYPQGNIKKLRMTTQIINRAT